MAPTLSTREATIGTRTFTVPPMRLGMIKPLLSKFAIVEGVTRGGIPSSEEVEALEDVVYAALSATDPAFTRVQFDALLASIDWQEALEQLSKAFAVIGSRSNMIKPSAGGAAGSGEAGSL